MTPRNHLPAAFSVLLIAALLVACAGQQATPTAAPVPPTVAPPTATPVPPADTPTTEVVPENTAATQAQPHQPRPDAPPYAVRGPHAVGVRDFVIDTPQRQIPVTVWYPALNPGKLPEAITYELGFPTNAQPNFTIAGQALADAAPEISGGPYPLLVHSHAGWTFRQDMAYLMEHLASQGFVVMAAGHEDNWGMLGENFYKSEISRPREVSNEIDFAEALTADGGELAGLIDTEHVAVSGWSIGGQVALEKAGARLNLVEQQKNYCATMRDLDVRCSFYATPIEEMAKLAGLEALPAGDWPDWSDPRVDAIVLFEPSEGSLGALPVEVQTPVLLIEGTIDDPGYGWEGIASEEKTAAILENAGHVVFMNNCTAQPGMSEGGFYGVCSDPVWDVNRVHDLVNHFVTAFLKAEFKDDAEAAKALAPENVAFTGVEYQTTAYGAAKPPAEPPAPQGLRPDAPEYAKRGPFPVGYQSLVIGEDTDRPLQAGLWYPALNPMGLEEEITYSVTPKIPVDQSDGPFVVSGHALQDAEVDASAGPYPLVVFSPGFACNAPWYNTLIENYASHGFVVLAPEHVEKFDSEWSDLAPASIDRPQDIKQTLDYAEAINAAGGDLAGLIDMQNVAVVGHSYGGYTSLAMAGAQYDLNAYNARCAQVSPDVYAVMCEPLVPKEADMAARAGLDPLPEGLWPSFGDPRVTAIVPIAGDSYLFDKAGLAKITVPMMAIGGSADTGTPYEWGSKPSYENASSAKKVLVTLEGAEHTISMGPCDNMPWMRETDFYQWICLDPVWDKDRGLDLINHFSTAFLLDTLKGDAKAAKALAPENVAFTGVEYQTAAYGAAKPPAEPPAPQGLRPDAPEYAKRGPFPVGYQSLVIGEDTDRPLQAGLWYPALNPMGLEEEITYSVTPKIPVDQTDGPFVVSGHALQNAAVDASAGPYPLVVFSHGFSVNAAWYNALIENFASHGFVVLAPEHVEKFDPEWSEIANASIDRPRDIKRTLDYAEQINAPAGDMAGLIDMEHVAVVGHSYGGYTALAAAGAQYDLDAFNARCAQLPPDDPLTFLCAPLVPKEAAMAARAGLDPMPEGLWPSLGDPRVTAIVAMAGDSYLFDKAGLSKITIPMLAIGGTADTATPYDWGSRPSYDNASSAKKALVTLEGAEHTVSMVSCDNMPWIKETDFYQWICLDPVWDKERGQDLIHHFSTAFLLDVLKGDAKAAAALVPENVSFPGITYEATGYGAAP